MTRCARRLMLAAILAAAVALLLCSNGAPVVRAAETSEFTAAQQANTLTVLRAFSNAIPALQREWRGDDFCGFRYVTCTVDRVSVARIPAKFTGTLPEMPEGVDYTKVMIKRLDFSMMAMGLSGTLPDSWSRLQLLRYLAFRKSNLTGTLPASWSALTSLRKLRMDVCKGITGSLPAEWSSMSSLSFFVGDSSSLTGTLPAEWGSSRALRYVLLTSTGISGTLPPEWGSLKAVQVLSLRNTGISGTLPPEWSGMTEARVVALDDCKLFGSLPSSWSAMRSLSNVFLSGNGFCGCVPDSWASNAGLLVSIEDEHRGRDCTTDNICPAGASSETPLTIPEV